MKNFIKYASIGLFNIIFIILCFSYFFNIKYNLQGIYSDNAEFVVKPNLSHIQKIDISDLKSTDFKFSSMNSLAVETTHKINVDNKSDKIIKDANIEFEVKDFYQAMDSVKSLVKLMNSNVASEDIYNQELNLYCHFSIKTPDHNFEKLIEKLLELSSYLDYQNIHTLDVSKEYIDVDTRLNTQNKLEETYLNLLKSTKSIKDILDIQEKLSEIRENIESTQGQLNLLKYQLTYYSIDLKIHGRNPNASKTKVTFMEQIGNSLKSGWMNLLGFINILLFIWPFIIILLIILYFVLRHRKRRKVVLDKK